MQKEINFLKYVRPTISISAHKIKKEYEEDTSNGKMLNF